MDNDEKREVLERLAFEATYLQQIVRDVSSVADLFSKATATIIDGPIALALVPMLPKERVYEQLDKATHAMGETIKVLGEGVPLIVGIIELANGRLLVLQEQLHAVLREDG